MLMLMLVCVCLKAHLTEMRFDARENDLADKRKPSAHHAEGFFLSLAEVG